MEKTLFWGGILLVGFWWMKNGNSSSSTNELGFGSTPVDDNISTSESANYWMKYFQATPAANNVNPIGQEIYPDAILRMKTSGYTPVSHPVSTPATPTYVHSPITDTPQQIRDRITYGSGL